MPKFEEISVLYITNIVRDFKLQPFQAAGFPGNFGVESVGFEKLQEINPIGGGRGGLGHGQFTGPRRTDFEKWIARHAMLGWNAGTFEANYSQVWRELTGNAASDESHVLPLLRAATTIEQATNIVCDRFERPNPDYAHKPERIAYAKRALAAFEASGINVAELMAAPRPGSTEPIPPSQEILPPLGKQPDLQALLTLIGPLLMPLLQQLATGQPLALPAPPAAPQPPTPPDPVVVVAPTPAKPDNAISMLFSILLGAGTAAGISTGTLGTPFEMGQAPTTAGSLMTIASIASPLLSYFGGYGALASMGLNVLSGLAKRVPQK